MAYPRLFERLFDNGGGGAKLRPDVLPDGLVKTVNGADADAGGNVLVDVGAKTVNGENPDLQGNVVLRTHPGLDIGLDSADVAAVHNSVYRGKDLTNVYTIDEISARIQNGSFEDLYIGDYVRKTITVESENSEGVITTNTREIRFAIADFNYWKNMGDTACTTNHAVMVPLNEMGTGRMNTTHTTEGGYANSRMHTFWVPKYATAIKSAFGSSHVLTHRSLLSDKVTTTRPSMAGNGLSGAAGTSWTWRDVDCCLMTEPMVYGTTVWSSSAYDVWCGKKQFALFRHSNVALNMCSDFWLSAVAYSGFFAFCGSVGAAGYGGAGSAFAIRPYFLLA